MTCSLSPFAVLLPEADLHGGVVCAEEEAVREIHVCLNKGHQGFINIWKGEKTLMNTGYGKSNYRVLRKLGTKHTLLHTV